MSARITIFAALLVLSGCGGGPDPNAAADAARINATARKAVSDVDAARRDAAIPPHPPEQTPG